MNKCIIHIGMHKTGSTSIQHSLDRYSDGHFVYATLLDNPNHSLPIYSLFAADPASHRLHREASASRARLEAYIKAVSVHLERAIVAARGRALIISGEGILRLEPDEVAKMADWFRNRFDQVIVVGYVRSPAEFMSSAFQQRIKAGAATFNLPRYYRNFRDTFAKFDDTFGRENVQLWKFDPITFPNKDVVSDFCTRLNLPLTQDRIVRLNESLSRQVVCALYTYNKFCRSVGSGKPQLAELNRLALALRELGGDKFRLSPDAIRPILLNNQDDIRWMEHRLGDPIDDPGSPSMPGDIATEADLVRADVAVAEILRKMLGRRAPQGISGRTPTEIAVLIDALRVSQKKRRLLPSWLTGRPQSQS